MRKMPAILGYEYLYTKIQINSIGEIKGNVQMSRHTRVRNDQLLEKRTIIKTTTLQLLFF